MMLAGVTSACLFTMNALAQLSDEEIPLCETSTGVLGRLFTGIAGAVKGPPGTNWVRDRDGSILDGTSTVWGTGVVLDIGIKLTAHAPGSKTLILSNAEKYADVHNAITHTCRVEVVDFDRDAHGYDAVRAGTCNLTGDLQTPLRVGESRTLFKARSFGSTFGPSSQVAELDLDGHQITLTGVGEGISNFTVTNTEYPKNEEPIRETFGFCTVVVEGYLTVEEVQHAEETTNTPSAPPVATPWEGPILPCKTSTGIGGTLFSNFHGYVEVPRVFDSAEAAGLEFLAPGPEVRSAFGPMIIPSQTGQSQVEFFMGDIRVFACGLTVIEFDLAKHTLDSLAMGQCDWIFDREIPMLTGIGRYIETPRFLELSTSNPKIMDVQPIRTDKVYAFGREPGVADVTMLDEGGFAFAGCPFVVEDATSYFDEHGLDDEMLCRADSGEPARLSPGQKIEVPFPESGLRELAVAEPRIAEVKPTRNNSAVITAVSAGYTNIVALNKYGTFLHECLIVVE